jgi:hypothetical protein
LELASTTEDSATTSTASCSWLTSRLAFSSVCWPRLTWTAFRLRVLNPLREKLSWYSPGGRFMTR